MFLFGRGSWLSDVGYLKPRRLAKTTLQTPSYICLVVLVGNYGSANFNGL